MSEIVTKSLDKIIDFKNGKIAPKETGSIPVYGGNGILGFANEFNYENVLIIGRVGAYCGSVHIEKGKCWVSDNAIAGISKIPTDIDYNYYLLKSISLNKKQIGSSQPLLTQGILNSIDLEIHDDTLIRQQIGNFLSSLDAKIELNNKINAELEAMAKTIYDYWFVQFDFPYSPPVEGLGVGQGKPYKSSGGKMVYNEQLKREIPEGWEVGTLNSLGDIIGGSTPPREVEEYFSTDGTAWITPKDLSLNTGNKFITKGELDVSEKGIKTASLNIMPKGTVLLSSRAPIGYLAISRENVTTNQGFKSFVPKENYSSEYIYYTVKNLIPTIENNAVGSTFKEVSASTLKSIKVFLPDILIVKKYTETVGSIFKRQNILELENQQLTQLRDWLLPMLMNGQVTVGAAQEMLGMVAEEREGYKSK